MNRLLAQLRNTDRPMRSYVWRAWLIAFIPSLVIGVVVGLAAPGSGPPFRGPAVVLVVGVLFVSPWIETLLMALPLWILQRLLPSPTAAAAVSAIGWGFLHSLAAPVWGFVVAWPFFVFSLCFLEWQKKSVWQAITATALVHMCQNALPALALGLTH